MSKPISTMVIGLGGSGAWSVVHVKRQLMDTYDNQIPNNVALAVLDTAKSSVAVLGGEGPKRRIGMGTGRVELDPHEYVHVGGNALDIAERVARNPDGPDYRHIGSWFLADYYLRSLPNASFHLDEGAGMYRQFGRLALFRDIMTPANSSVAAILRNKLVQVANMSPGSPAISVMVVGSLTGGTGAGMFLDVPHLIQQVASQNSIDVTLRGFLFLPQAFQGVLNTNDLQPAKGRAFAAMRELQRFLLNEDYKYGYPMYYHPERSAVDKYLWRAESRGKLYDFVYLIDGENNQMNRRPLKDAIAPVVADAILNFVDGTFGPQQKQNDANLRAKISTRQGVVGKQAFVSGLGAYSVILPVQQIIEGWAHDFSLDFMRQLVPPSRVNDRGHIVELSAAHVQGHEDGDARGEVRRLLDTDTPLIDPRDPEHKRQVFPMRMWREVFRFFSDYQESAPQIRQELNAYSLGHWLQILVPGGANEQDRTMKRAVSETKQILNEKLVDSAQNSDDRRPRGEPASDAPDIIRRAEAYINSQLGAPVSGGGRSGGRYGEALQRFERLQVQRFRDFMAAYMLETLNGRPQEDPVIGRTGKLGWLIALMTELRTVFATVSELLEEIRSGRGTLDNNARAQLNDFMQSSQQEMQRAARETGFGSRRRAVKAQDTYINSVQDFVGFYRTDFARNAVAGAIQRIREELDTMIAMLTGWREALATDINSLHNSLLDGSNRVRGERERAETVQNHWIINDDRAWEDKQYEDIIQTGQAGQALFAAWEWSIDLDGDRMTLNAGLRAPDGSEVTQLNVEKHGRWAQDNSDAILSYARQFFRSSASRLSILGYLMHRYAAIDGEEQLGQRLAEKSGSLLSMRTNNLTGGRIPQNVLLAKYDESAPEQSRFLNNVLNAIVAAQGRGSTLAAGENGGQGQADTVNIFHSNDDPFRLTFLSTEELVPMAGVTAYEDCNAVYKTLPRDARRTTHIFPAEVRAVEYEELLPTLGQERRVLTDRVSLLLENEERFKLFFFLLTHGIVIRGEVEESQVIEYVWALQMPAERRRSRGQMQFIWLSQAASNPKLMDAVVTFVLLGNDLRALEGSSGMHQPIDYEQAFNYLVQVREQQTMDRVLRDQLALHGPIDANGEPELDQDGYPLPDEDLRFWLEAFMIDQGETMQNMLDAMSEAQRKEYLDVANLVVQHDMMLEMGEFLRQEVPELKQTLEARRGALSTGEDHDQLRQAEEDYDLYSTAIIMLDEQIEGLRDRVKQRFEAKTGQDQMGGIRGGRVR